ncbi:MAG: ABC transporter permease [Chloroflexota bacterium]
MVTYIIRRLLIAVPIFFGITVIVFLLLAIAPGDPVSAFIRPELASNEAMRQAIIQRYGLDQPLPIRYIHWLAEAVQGNLGFKAGGVGLPVLDTVQRGFVASMLLMGTALLIGIFVGIPLGILSALRQYSKLDYALTGVAFLGISMPTFLLGLGGLYLFGIVIRIFPIGGMVTAGAPFSFGDLFAHLALPALILGVGYVAILMRYTRSAMLEVLGSLYVTTAVAKGLPNRTVVTRHAFRNALIPIITIIGLSLPELVGGAVIIETVFSWPGMGNMMVEAVAGRDFPMVMGLSLVVAIFVLLANLMTDVAYAVADPRVRYT